MKIKAFHQFVFLEKGPVNTAIIDFLKENVFQARNEIVEKFINREYKEISKFIRRLEMEELIIDIDEKRWIPRIEFASKREKDVFFDLEVEEGQEFNLIMKKFGRFNISKIFFFGKDTSIATNTSIKIVLKKKNFNNCVKNCKVNGSFGKFNEMIYLFTECPSYR